MQVQKSGKKLDGKQDFHKLGKAFGQINDCRKKKGCTDSWQPSSSPSLKEAVELLFLPPNTTSELQPMDHGVIRALKTKCRSSIVKLCITYLEAKGEVPRISILDAMRILVQV